MVQDLIHTVPSPTLIAVVSETIAEPVRPPSLSWRRSPWVYALLLVITMLRNVALSAVVAWVFAILMSRGNLLSTIPPQLQSREIFLASSLVVTNLTSTLKYWCIASVRWYFFRRRSDGPNHKVSNLTTFALRVARGSASHIALSSAITVVLAALFTASWFPASIKPLRLDFYGASWASHYVLVATDVVARRISRQETAKAMEINAMRQIEPTPLHRPRSSPSIRQVLRAYRKTLPLYLSVVVAGLYVQLTSQWIFSTSSEFASDGFIIASLALKILVQELTKRFLQRRRVKLLYLMCVFVSLPTVLIDTQVRVVILSLNNSQSTLSRTYAMSVLEILVRLGKVWMVRKTIDKKSQVVARKATNTRNQVFPTNSPRLRSSTSFKQWCKQQIDLHTAETFADMYAEYIAIGCAAAITYYFGNGNPHYRLGGAGGNVIAHAGLASALATQVLVEVATDYISSMMEMYLIRTDGGHEISRLGGFLGILSVAFAVINVQVSALLYLKIQ